MAHEDGNPVAKAVACSNYAHERVDLTFGQLP